MNRLSESLKTTKEIAESIGVSKSTVYRFIKSNLIHESSQIGSALLYDESVEKLISEGLGLTGNSQTKPNESPRESIESVQNELISTLKKQIEDQGEQLKVKDNQIAELQKSNDQLQQLLLFEQQRYITKIEEDTQKEKRWWQWWKT